MDKYAKEYSNYYPKTFIAAIILVFMATHLITRSDKPREDFTHIQGTISHLSKEPPFEFSRR